jgi:tRNA(His) guanylyltransferase
LLQDPSSGYRIETEAMANSRFTYVRDFELADKVLPNTWMLVRIDGKGFHKQVSLRVQHRIGSPGSDLPYLCVLRFSRTHNFAKPNDKRALDLMDRAAEQVMTEVADVIVAFGESDEYR